MSTIFALFDLGGGQILLILALILIFFGAKRIPELAKGLGQGIKEFKKATREVTEEINNAAENKTESVAGSSNSQDKQIAGNAPVDKPATVSQSAERKA
jgi:sec-independent protein translocase protein TatA